MMEIAIIAFVIILLFIMFIIIRLNKSLNSGLRNDSKRYIEGNESSMFLSRKFQNKD